MKKFTFILSLMLIGFLASSQPKLTFNTLMHDFGTIDETSGLATVVFKFKSTGNQPVILNNVHASCGCTTPTWTSEPVTPGKEGKIEISYNPKNRPGAFSKTITVYSNAEPQTTRLTITGTVTPRVKPVEELYPRLMGPLRTRSNYVSFGPILNSEVKTQELIFMNVSENPVTIGVHRIAPHITLEFVPEMIQPNETGKVIVHFDAKQKNSFGYINDRIYLTLNGEQQSQYNISVTATLKEDFTNLSEKELAMSPVASISETRFDFGEIQQGAKVTHNFILKNDGKSELLLRNVKTSCGCTAVKYDKVIKPGSSTTIQVVFNSKGKRNRQNKTVTIICNDPNNSTIVLRMVGTVLGPE